MQRHLQRHKNRPHPIQNLQLHNQRTTPNTNTLMVRTKSNLHPTNTTIHRYKKHLHRTQPTRIHIPKHPKNTHRKIQPHTHHHTRKRPTKNTKINTNLTATKQFKPPKSRKQ